MDKNVDCLSQGMIQTAEFAPLMKQAHQIPEDHNIKEDGGQGKPIISHFPQPWKNERH